MDQIVKIKKICKDLLDISYGDQILIVDLVVRPTFKYDENIKDWTKDSYSVFLTLKNQKPGYFLEQNFDIFLESYLGLDFCVEFS